MNAETRAAYEKWEAAVLAADAAWKHYDAIHQVKPIVAHDCDEAWSAATRAADVEEAAQSDLRAALVAEKGSPAAVTEPEVCDGMGSRRE